MTHTYQITGMTCAGCESKVKSSLLSIPDIEAVDVDRQNNSANITMGKHVGLSTLQEALGGTESKYQITAEVHSEMAEEAKSFFEIYKPVLLIFGYVMVVSFLTSWQNGSLEWTQFMRFFMAGFFLSFSFFKLINLEGFADSYSMYDIVAKRFKAWGYIYAFIELTLGIAFLTDFNPVLTNWATLVVMSVSIIGVLQSVLKKKQIQCACLGAVFNLPMSTITIIEDLLMIGMSGTMLLLM